MGASPYDRTNNNIGDILAGAASPPSAASPTPSASSPQPAAASPHHWHSHQRHRRPAPSRTPPPRPAACVTVGDRRPATPARMGAGTDGSRGEGEGADRGAHGSDDSRRLATATDMAARGAHRRHPQAAATPRAGAAALGAEGRRRFGFTP